MLNEMNKQEIVRLYEQGHLSQSKIAQQFGIAQSSVSKIIKKYKADSSLSEEVASSKKDIPIAITNEPLSHPLDMHTVDDVDVSKVRVSISIHGIWLNKKGLELIGDPEVVAYFIEGEKLYICDLNHIKDVNNYYFASSQGNYSKMSHRKLMKQLTDDFGFNLIHGIKYLYNPSLHDKEYVIDLNDYTLIDRNKKTN